MDVDVLFNLLSDDKSLADNIILAQKRIDELNQQQNSLLSDIQNEMNVMRNNLNNEIGNINSQVSGEANSNPDMGNPQL